jgi:hypothetical protein
MQEIFVFNPPRRLGIMIHLGALLALGLAAIWALWQATRVDIGAFFLSYLLLALLSVAALPLVAYRAYALYTAAYTLERNGIRLRWGLRQQVIPIDAVIWVHPAEKLSTPVPLPWLRWHGAVLGVRRLPGGSEVEFMAATASRLVFISTEERLYGISPEDPQAFLQTYQRFTEMGSITPLAARAQHPTILFSQVWRTPAARTLILAGLALCLAALAWCSLVVPGRAQVHLGFYPDGSPGVPVPATQLLLLPVLCTLFYVLDLFLGLFFFRRQEAQPLSYLLWGCGALTPLLSLVAIYFMLQAG